MKKTLLAGLAMALIVASTTWAGFGLPKINTGNSTVNSIANKGLDAGKNAAVAKIINDRLTKYNCQFKDDKTTTDTTCNIDKVISELTSWKSGLEGTIVNKVTVNVRASAKAASSLASNRAQEIRNRLWQRMSWWDYSVTSNTNEGNGLFISVSVK